MQTCVRFNVIVCGHYRGAGQEVGRSCIILEFKGRKIMVNILVMTASITECTLNVPHFISHHIILYQNLFHFIFLYFILS